MKDFFVFVSSISMGMICICSLSIGVLASKEKVTNHDDALFYLCFFGVIIFNLILFLAQRGVYGALV